MVLAVSYSRHNRVAYFDRSNSPLKPPMANQRGGNKSDSKPLYGEKDIATLMGFSHVKKGSDLQDMWTYFQASKGKNLEAKGMS